MKKENTDKKIQGQETEQKIKKKQLLKKKRKERKIF